MRDRQLPFMAHLVELRRRLTIAATTWMVAAFVCYTFADRLFVYISEPVRKALPEGSRMVFLSATEPFFTYMKIAAIAGLIIALPVVLWQIWAFVGPALYPGEKRFAMGFVLASTLCFVIGAYFGFTFVFPTVFAILVKMGIGATDVNAMLSMGAYLSLASTLLLAFGLVFELPIVIFILARMGVVDHHWLRKNRKYMIVVAFIVAGIITPGPDIFSQLSLAVPFVVLYEVGVLLARFFGKERREPAPTPAPE